MVKIKLIDRPIAVIIKQALQNQLQVVELQKYQRQEEEEEEEEDNKKM